MERTAMKKIHLDKVACPHDGTSGADNLNANSQIEYTGRVDGEGWISCPNCGGYAEFTEEGTVTDSKVSSAFKWAVTICSAIDGVSVADAMDTTAADADAGGA